MKKRLISEQIRRIMDVFISILLPIIGITGSIISTDLIGGLVGIAICIGGILYALKIGKLFDFLPERVKNNLEDVLTIMAGLVVIGYILKRFGLI